MYELVSKQNVKKYQKMLSEIWVFKIKKDVNGTIRRHKA